MEQVRLYAMREIQKRKETWEPLQGPLQVTMTFYRTRPKSARKSLLFPVTRPDLSNFQKLVEDSLNNLVWRDDSHIVTALTYKRFADGAGPRTEVLVEEVADGV
jgi:Holliday junction resolvase RusA-like endonuclease